MTNRFMKILSVIFVIGLIAIGCSEDDDNTVGVTLDDATFALQSGNWWQYDQRHGGESWGFSINQIDTTTMNGEKVFLNWSTSLPGYVHKGEQGLYSYSPGSNESDLWWKYPASSGDTYYWNSGNPDYEYRFEVTSINSSITVPAGTFTGCYEYTVSSFRDQREPKYDYLKYYFKPTIGLIYRSEERNEILYEDKLLRYHISGGGISSEARTLADENWNEDVYKGYEYWIAQNYQPPDRQYTGTAEEWLGESWEDKLDYTPTWFAHDFPSEKNESYYNVIGWYPQQYGIGWEGAHDEWDESVPEQFFGDYLVENKHVNFSNEYLDQYLDLW